MMHSAPPSGGVVHLPETAPQEPVRDLLATTLGDPSVRVVYWIAGEDVWADHLGARQDEPGGGLDRATFAVERGGATLAVVEHHAALSVGAEVAERACAALAGAIDREHTVAALRVRVRSLEAAEQRLREVFDAIDLMVVAIDLDARMTYVNPFTERLSGWGRGELVGRNWFETFRSGRESFLERVRAGEFPPRDLSTIIVRSGERREIDWYNVALRDESGQVVGILGMGRDLTGEIQARRSLEAAERRMRDVLETVQLLAVQIDLDGRITYANEYLVRMSGWTQEELLGQNWFETFRTGSEDAFERVRAGEVEPHNQTPLRLRSDEQRIVDWYNVPLRDDAGELVGLVGVGRDVTDQIRAEQEVRELAAEHAALERVATEVARGLGGDQVFRLVAQQAGGLVGADGCTLLRFLPGYQAQVMAHWSDVAPARETTEGRIIPVGDGPAMAATYRSGRPERFDEPGGGRRNPTGGGDPIRSAVAAPITVSGEMWGTLVAWRVIDEPLPGDTERRLGAFTSLVGTAIANADARTALAESRKRIVAAADDARRRLERNLHDGAQQRFVSLALALRLTLAGLRRDPEGAGRQLAEALEELSTGLEELRELARGIHPAVLTDRGLSAAVETLVSRVPVPVEVEEVPSERLPADVEAAAYYVVAEALTNVARYAEATRATVRIELRDAVATVEVADDGKGGAEPADGSGLRGLADRVEAIGGWLDVDSPDGSGTRVRAVIPAGK
jgi:PAS domain S-box-containing protein